MANSSKRLQKEITDILKAPPTWCSASVVGDNLHKWKASVVGPEGSPFEKGSFDIDIDIPNDYPFKPPALKFTTKIYHPNIKSDGSVCSELLSQSWSPQLKIYDVLVTIRALLNEPNPDNPLEVEIAQQFKSDRNAFNKTAKEWTKKYAKFTIVMNINTNTLVNDNSQKQQQKTTTITTTDQLADSKIDVDDFILDILNIPSSSSKSSDSSTNENDRNQSYKSTTNLDSTDPSINNSKDTSSSSTLSSLYSKYFGSDSVVKLKDLPTPTKTETPSPIVSKYKPPISPTGDGDDDDDGGFKTPLTHRSDLSTPYKGGGGGDTSTKSNTSTLSSDYYYSPFTNSHNSSSFISDNNNTSIDDQDIDTPKKNIFKDTINQLDEDGGDDEFINSITPSHLNHSNSNNNKFVNINNNSSLLSITNKRENTNIEEKPEINSINNNNNNNNLKNISNSSKKKKRLNYDLISGKENNRPIKLSKSFLTPKKSLTCSSIQNHQLSPPRKQNNNSTNFSKSNTTSNFEQNGVNSTSRDNNENISRVLDFTDDVMEDNHNKGKDNNNNIINNDTIYCPICQSIPTNPHSSVCGHICCFECWCQWLSLKLECPICKERARVKLIKPVVTTL
eukprot:gene4886-6094_t